MKNTRLTSGIKTVLVFFILFSVPSILRAQTALTLERALEIAETSSPSIKTSLLNLETNQKNLEAQRAALKTKFGLTVNPISYSNSRQFDTRTSEWYTNESLSSNGTLTISQPILITDGTISLNNRFGWQQSSSTSGMGSENKAFTNNLYLSINQPLFTYNTQRMQLQQLELSLENAKISYAMQRLNLEKNVSQYFYNVYMAQMNLSIAEDELKNTQNSYNIIKNKVDAGLASKDELYQAELNLASSKSSVQSSQVSYENAKDNLKMYLGMDLYEDIVIVANVEANPIEIDLEKAIENGLTNRMEIRQREITIENNQFSLIRTKAQNEFKGSVNASVGIVGDNEYLDQIFDNTTRNPQVSVSFNIPLIDWGERKARIAASEATIESSQVSLDQQKQQIIIDIRQVYRNLQNNAIQIDIARQSETNAQLTYDINLKRYESGDLTGMDLNQYQTQLSQKKLAYSQALINYKIELLNMKIQSLYDFENDKPIIPTELYNTNIEN